MRRGHHRHCRHPARHTLSYNLKFRTARRVFDDCITCPAQPTLVSYISGDKAAPPRCHFLFFFFFSSQMASNAVPLSQALASHDAAGIDTCFSGRQLTFCVGLLVLCRLLQSLSVVWRRRPMPTATLLYTALVQSKMRR
jgi:hypothetical protein